MQKPKIIDNALPAIEFEAIRSAVSSGNFPWFWSPRLNAYQKDDYKKVNHFYMYHNFNIYNNNAAPPYNQIFVPLLKLLKPKVLIRIHTNMYSYSPKLEEHADHKDQKFPCDAALLYLNTCNGSTVINKKYRVESVANRLVKFRAHWWHHSTNCTDQKRRLIVNVNYI